jgi:hypothetical protein
MKSILICVLLLSMSHVEAKRFYAKVIMLKGKVSKLAPGDRNASWIKKGDILKDDTSLYSEKGSFARIQILKDKSYVTLGPKSKLVLNKIKKNKGSVLSVLTGTIRAKVNKKRDSADKKSKLYIKSQTAVMGVRGTELVVAVNQENKVTSLVTLEGEVAMARVDEGPTVEPVEQVVEEAVDNAPPEEVETVAKGRASTAYQHKEEVTPPTKVNPVQLVALKQNENMDDKIKKNAKPIKVTEEMKKDLYAPDTEEEKKEGRDKVPENGGVVDLNSGIFIPPVEKDMDIGKVDPSTGRFVAANDIKLDPVKGFVPKDEKSEKGKKLAEKLNKVVEYKEVPKNYAPSTGHTVARSFKKKENSYEVGFSLGLGGTTIKPNEGGDQTSDLATLFFELNFMSRLPSSYGHTYMLGADLVGVSYDAGEFEQAQDDDDRKRIGLNIHIGAELQQIANLRVYFLTGLRTFFTPVFAVGGLSSRDFNVPKIDVGTILQLNEKSTLDGKFSRYYSDTYTGISLIGGNSLSVDYRRLPIDRNWTWGVKAEYLELNFNENIQNEYKTHGYMTYMF